MDKQIDIHIFDMDDKLFQELFSDEQNSIDAKNIEKIENRKKYFGVEKKDEELKNF